MPAKRKPRHYSDEERAAALAALKANAGNVTETHRQTGIPRNTLGDWKKQQKASGETPAGDGPARHNGRGVPEALVAVAEQKLDQKLEGLTHVFLFGHVAGLDAPLAHGVRVARPAARPRMG